MELLLGVPCVDSCLLCLPVRDPPLCALSDLCRAGAGLQGPLGPEGETAETPGTGSGREGLLPLTEQGCGESCLCPGPCLTTMSPGRLGRNDSPFPSLPPFSPIEEAFHAVHWRWGGGG